MKKRILSIILSAIMIFSLIPTGLFTASALEYTESFFTYNIDILTGEAEITDVDETVEGYLLIPEEVDGHPVTAIGDWAFNGCSYLTGVRIPDSITAIKDQAFNYCSSLTEIEIPISVRSIGDDAFSFCESMESVLIGSNVRSIGKTAFSHCKNLKNVIIGSNVKTIGDGAFYVCEGLESITIPSSVESIGTSLFSGCSSLEMITVHENNEHYRSDGNCIIEIESNTVVEGCKTSVIPEGVTAIGDLAFSFRSSLESIIIPSGVQTIGEAAFQGCRRLNNITVPSSLTEVGKYAFNGASHIRDVYYNGTEEEKENISIGDYNDGLLNANWHYAGEEVLGDCDGNGEVDILDVQNLFETIVNGNIDEVSLQVGDINGDGEVNIIDVQKLFVMVANGEI